MAIVQEAGASVVGVGAGLGSTYFIKQRFDAATETTVMRPSVLWGWGTGGLAFLLPWLMGWRDGDVKKEFLQDYGEGALVAGTASAVTPGNTVQFPTL